MFYTSVNSKKNKIYVRGYKNSKSFKKEVLYKPYLFVDSKSESEYHTIDGDPVAKMDFDSMQDARDFIYSHKSMETFKIYGMNDFKYPFIYDNFKGDIEFDVDLINVIALDIENDYDPNRSVEEGVKLADKEITAISLARKDGKTLTVGLKDVPVQVEDNHYIYCDSEEKLLRTFLEFWNTPRWRPDVLTGWNIVAYDIPYLVNRIKNVLGEEEANKLSPFEILEPREVRNRWNNAITLSYGIFGIQILDYYIAYKKFAKGERENYSLAFISQYELEETKVDYSEYGNLNDLYRKNPKLYYEYNIHDVNLIQKLEEKLHYLDQIIIQAYIMKCNFENVLATCKQWDAKVHNYLMDQKIVVPFFEESDDNEKIMGGFVKDPIPGLYRWVGALDFTSLYPTVAMTFNISPDTFVSQLGKRPDVDKLIHQDDVSKLTEELKKRDCAMTANGCLFKKDHRGFLPAIMKFFFEERKRYRKLEAKAREEYEKDEKNHEKRNLFMKYYNIQTAFKLINNSGYGAIACKWFRWFANPLAEGITSSGQMASKYVGYRLNLYMNKELGTEGKDFVIYQDTDSAYIDLSEFVKKWGLTDEKEILAKLMEYVKVLSIEVDRLCQELCDKLNVFENDLSMKIEKINKAAFWTGKKYYALQTMFDEGIVYDPPKVKVTGLHPVRVTTPPFTKKAMKDCYTLIFNDDRKGLIKYIQDFKERFSKMPFQDIGWATGVNNIGKWKSEAQLYRGGCPIHVRGSIVFNRWLDDLKLDNRYEKVYDHDKVKCCYLLPNPTKENVISIKGDPPKEMEIEKYVDYETQFAKVFGTPFKIVCDAIQWNMKEISTLEEIFE